MTKDKNRGGGEVGQSDASGRLVVIIPSETDLSRKKQVVTAPLLNPRQ